MPRQDNQHGASQSLTASRRALGLKRVRSPRTDSAGSDSDGGARGSGGGRSKDADAPAVDSLRLSTDHAAAENSPDANKGFSAGDHGLSSLVLQAGAGPIVLQDLSNTSSDSAPAAALGLQPEPQLARRPPPKKYGGRSSIRATPPATIAEHQGDHLDSSADTTTFPPCGSGPLPVERSSPCHKFETLRLLASTNG